MSAIKSQILTTARRVRIDPDRSVMIRPIDRIDTNGVADFYEGLSLESMRRRFLSCGVQSEHDLAVAFTAKDGEGIVAILEALGPRDGAVVAHATVQPDGCGGAEVALAVADDLQGYGIGTSLMCSVVQQVRGLGLRRMTATTFLDNAPMQRLLRGAGCEIASDEIDVGTEEITLAI